MATQTIYTALGWAVVLGAGGALYFYYKPGDQGKRTFRARGQSRGQQVVEHLDPRQNSGRVKRREAKRTTSDSPNKNEKTADNHPVSRSSAVEKDKDDAAFAHELAQRRKGASFKTSASSENRQKTVKQSNANKRAEMSATSSEAPDVEDENSPAEMLPLTEQQPPQQEPHQQQQQEMPSGKNVSDMLEAPSAAPAVLRLTEAERPLAQKKARESKPAPEQETKKQRQNRKKKEEARLVREQQESDRRGLLESQRRTAREARGEPAKNGIPIAAAPTSSPWVNGANHAHTAVASGTDGPLLDTFAPDTASTSSSLAPETPASSSVNGGNVEYHLPDEDEQMRQLMEQDESAWTSVPSKGNKKGKSEGTVSSGGAVQAPGKPSKSSLYNSTSGLHALGGDVEA